MTRLIIPIDRLYQIYEEHSYHMESCGIVKKSPTGVICFIPEFRFDIFRDSIDFYDSTRTPPLRHIVSQFNNSISFSLIEKEIIGDLIIDYEIV